MGKGDRGNPTRALCKKEELRLRATFLLSSPFLNSKEDKEKGGWRVEKKVPNFAELNTLLLESAYAP